MDWFSLSIALFFSAIIIGTPLLYEMIQVRRTLQEIKEELARLRGEDDN